MFYKQTLHSPKGSDGMKAIVLGNLEKPHRDAELLAVLKQELDKPRYNGRLDYLCLGCQVGDGALREQLIGLAAYPLMQKAVEELLGYQIVLQAYHANAYEPEADPGPGGVVGIKKMTAKAIHMPDTSAATALKMWLWVNAETNYDYLPEEQAEAELWALVKERCAEGLAYLSRMDWEPTVPQTYPIKLRHDMHTLLGVAAIRRLVEANTGKRLVLVDSHRFVGKDFLAWEQAYA